MPVPVLVDCGGCTSGFGPMIPGAPLDVRDAAASLPTLSGACVRSYNVIAASRMANNRPPPRP